MPTVVFWRLGERQARAAVPTARAWRINATARGVRSINPFASIGHRLRRWWRSARASLELPHGFGPDADRPALGAADAEMPQLPRAAEIAHVGLGTRKVLSSARDGEGAFDHRVRHGCASSASDGAHSGADSEMGRAIKHEIL